MIHLSLRLLFSTLLLFALCPANSAQHEAVPEKYSDRADVRAFIDDLAINHDFDRAELMRLFAEVQRQQKALDAIARPAEAKPWHEYRKIFITPARIAFGVRFWRENEALLNQAEQAYDVPASIIVAIIGVETFYGNRMGTYPVFHTLTTLGFDYPPRADFFQRELRQLLLLAREESLDLHAIKGSYAGAMGQGQFIPSSFRHYAVDFDNDGKRDLWNSKADAIGSVANYFQRHGWRLNSKITVPANTDGTAHKKLLGRGMKPSITPATLKSHGVKPKYGQALHENVAFFEFDTRDGKQHWIGFDNFYVITRYNRSPLYAMAVYQLSREITQARSKDLAKNHRQGLAK